MAAGLAHGSDHRRDVLIGMAVRPEDNLALTAGVLVAGSADRPTRESAEPVREDRSNPSGVGVERCRAPQGCPSLLVGSRPQPIHNDLPQRLSGHLHCGIVIGSGWL
jgi:hypothetical protein